MDRKEREERLERITAIDAELNRLWRRFLAGELAADEATRRELLLTKWVELLCEIGEEFLDQRQSK